MSTERLERVYDWWSRHPRVFRALSALLSGGHVRTLRAESVEWLALQPGETVLDLACGTGVSLDQLADRVGPHGTVLGLDLSAGMSRVAAERAQRIDPGAVHVLRGDGGRPPLADGSVDAVYSSLSLSAVPDLARVVDASHRLLRPGGRLVVLDGQRVQSGPLRVVNPLVEPVSRWATAWRPDRDVAGALRERFDEVTVAESLGGSFFIARAERR